MKCPFCSHEATKVTDKREAPKGIRRRRECLHCGKRFTTYERLDPGELYVIKKDGRRVPYNKDKILLGIVKACEKRAISHDKIDKVVEEIEKKLRKRAKGKEVKSQDIGEMIMKALKKLDNVAYIRFASVYREFEDVSDFKKELRSLK